MVRSFLLEARTWYSLPVDPMVKRIRRAGIPPAGGNRSQMQQHGYLPELLRK